MTAQLSGTPLESISSLLLAHMASILTSICITRAKGFTQKLPQFREVTGRKLLLSQTTPVQELSLPSLCQQMAYI